LATTEERNRLARDIHDSLGHYLTVTNVQIAKALAFQYRDPLIAEQAMRHAKDTAHEALRAVRQSVGALRTTRDTFVFAPALTALVERTRTDGCEIAVHVEGNEAFFSTETLTALYYVTQEGLTNIQKHARATDVAIDVSFIESEASLTIRDNGSGFLVAAIEDTEHGADGGYGLHSMRERLTRVGGRLIIASHPGAGTTLSVFAPRTQVTAAELPGNGAGKTVKA
jgi:signal transduction histidine kinase